MSRVEARVPEQGLNIGERVNRLFESRLSPRGRRYTLREVSEGTGGRVTIPWLSALRRGRFEEAGGDKLQALADFFRVDVGYFLGRPAPPPTAQVLPEHAGLSADEILSRGLSTPGMRALVQRATALEGEGVCRLILAEAQYHARRGWATHAHVAAVQAEQLAAAPGRELLAAEALRLQAGALVLQGNLEQALARAQVATDLAGKRTASRDVLRGQLCTARLLWSAGRLADARDLGHTLLATARRQRWTEEQASSALGVGACLLELGQLDPAEKFLLEARMLAQHLEDPQLRARANYHLGQIWSARAEVPGGADAAEAEETRHTALRWALDYLQDAHDEAREHDLAVLAVVSALAWAVAVTRLGGEREDGTVAVGLVRFAEGTLMSLGSMPVVEAVLQVSEAEIALGRGGDAVALPRVRRAAAVLEQGAPVAAAWAHRVAALVATARAAPALAAGHWQASRSAAVRHGQVLEERRTRRAQERGPTGGSRAAAVTAD